MKSDLFIPTLGISLAVHLIALATGYLQSESPHIAVIEAPNTVEVVLLEKYAPPDSENRTISPIKEKQQEESMEKIRTSEKSVFVESSFPKHPSSDHSSEFSPKNTKKQNTTAPQPVISQESRGAQTKAQPLNDLNPAPLYPQRARRRGWEGIVILKVEVSTEGVASRIEIMQSSGYPILDKAALNTVQKWRFAPAQAGGVRLSSWIKVPIEFKLLN